MTRILNADKVIVALDVPNLKTARPLIDKLADTGVRFKVGLELITAQQAGGAAELIHKRGGKVFWDGKFDDIPKTVGKAAAALVPLKVSMFSVHASASVDSMMAAVANKECAQVFAVTVLTTHDDDESVINFGAPRMAKVLQFARNAALAGCAGIICSPLELAMLARRTELSRLLKITPAVRPKWAAPDGQKIYTTPAAAFAAGADAIVVGDPVRNPPPEIGTPIKALRLICEEILA